MTNTVAFFSDISSLKYEASQTFKNAVEYADPSAGWVRYQEVLDIINEKIEQTDSRLSSGKASAITPEEMASLFHVNGETLAIGHPVSKEINPFDDMERFQDAIHSAFPECYDSIHCIEDPAIIRDLLDSINTPTYDNRLWYNDGRHNLEIYYYEPLDENNYIINNCQHVIKKIWCITSDNLYDDLFLLEWETPEPYVINGKQYTHVLRLNGKIYPGDTIDTGKIRLEDGKVHSISNFKDALEISIIPSYFNYMFIAPHSNSFTNPKNDKLLLRLKGNPITGDLLMGLVPALEKRDEVLMRL